VTSAAFSPDESRIVTTSWDKKDAQLWDAKTGKAIGAPLTGHSEGVVGAAFSPNGSRIVTASADRTARLWNAEGKPILEPLRGHRDHVRGAAFSPDGSRIVTASLDKTARQWDSETAESIGELNGHGDVVWSAAFSPDGRQIVTASSDRTARLWEVLPRRQALIDRSKALVPRCLTQTQRKQLQLSAQPPSWCIELEKWPYHAQAWKNWLASKRAGKNPKLPEE
jgi:WD40 repeat protein